MRLVSLIVLFGIFTFGQSFKFESTIGNFKGASSFFINPAGIIYVTDSATDEIYMIDTLGVPVRSIGGYGWRESAFDNPIDVFADALKVFVTDKNNHRIQRFDKNLNYNFQISTRESSVEEERFGYPLSAVMSNQGDIFILDSENLRILKFDIFGNFIQNFAGYDYGNYALTNPKQLAISMQNNIFVIDDNVILIFDQFGNGIGRVEGEQDFSGIKIIFNELVINTDEMIFYANLRNPGLNITEVKLTAYEEAIKIVSALIFNNKLYLLTKKQILVFNKSEL
jgi:DNA-binding beta-propeller fold protein YncE